MITIYKYPLKTGVNKVEIYSRHRILSVGIDSEQRLCLWAMVDTGSEKENIAIEVFGTGWEINNYQTLRFLGTVTEGSYVWHAFKRLTGAEIISEFF